MTLGRQPWGTVEQRILMTLHPDETVRFCAVCERLPDVQRGTIASALLHMVASRSLVRVRRGAYLLTEQGQARRAEHTAKQAAHGVPA